LQYTIFGIRHHGPGSAKSLRQALQQLAPDCLLIEAPADAEKALKYADDSNLRPPVALLLYAKKDIQQAAYFPFASFSPEWQAIRYGFRQNIPIRFMDLPAEVTFGLEAEKKEQQQLAFAKTPPSEIDREVVKDPLGYMAQLAGYTDRERWWEVTFEQQDNELDIFTAVLEMMTELRSATKSKERPDILRREAHMRKMLRKALKDGFQNIAIVCGAWHAPALHQLNDFTAKADNALLRGLKKEKAEATWIPWTYELLSTQSGYRAGVLSPAWYELLFQNTKEATTRWMVKAARLIRDEDLTASTAHAMEGVRLAETLATLRQLPLPGIEELKEAAITSLCEGATSRFTLIEQKLIMGEATGKVPEQVTTVALQKDIDQLIKSNRLTKYHKSTKALWLLGNASNPQGGLDLREESHRQKSQFLHRLNILDVPFGEIAKTSRNDQGSFKEYWKLKWKANFALRIIKAAGSYGNTVETAAHVAVLRKAEEIERLPELLSCIEQALYADLDKALPSLLQRLDDLSAMTQDILHLLEALPVLVRILRYGDVRDTDVSLLEQVVEHSVPRICIGLPAICISIDDELASSVVQKIRMGHQSIHLLHEVAYSQQWYDALRKVMELPAVNPLVQGTVVRLLLDKNVIATEVAARKMQYALSGKGEAELATAWLEGFLKGSGLVLIHNNDLWAIINDWVIRLSPSHFREILPILRRTFSDFSQSERSQMLDLAKGKSPFPTRQKETVPADDLRVVRQSVLQLLGYEGI